MRYYFAPMEGVTDSVYRRLHHAYFGGVDRYYMPFFSPTMHRTLTGREDRELPPASSVPFAAVPQVLTKSAEDFCCLQRRGGTSPYPHPLGKIASAPGDAPSAPGWDSG